jgi:L-2-hydroxyglutarate oxidase LhgO
LQESPGAAVTVIEKEDVLARHQTGHNSGVVHAGLYYEPDSLKARLCRRGGALLKQFCIERGLTFEACGKVVVATDERELARLDRLEERAAANRVPGLRRLGPTELRELEPHVAGIEALHSPETAIVDFAAVARAMASDVADGGGSLRLATSVARVRPNGRLTTVDLADGTGIEADCVIVCAGLHADRLARASGQPADPRIVPFRGEYWQLRPERTHLVRGLIYPVPDPDLPFLGIHLTRKIDGSVLIGPNAILALAREGYQRRTISLRDVADSLGWPGTTRLMRRHWRAGLQEIVTSTFKPAFIRAARRYVPELRACDAIPARAGVRAQAIGRDGTLVDDFRLGVSGGVVWVRNAPSPAATSSLAIAEEIVSRLAVTGPGLRLSGA